MSCRLRKPTICICENKDAVTAQLISALFFLNPKFQTSSLLLRLYSLVCVGPGRKPKLLVFSCEGSNMIACLKLDSSYIDFVYFFLKINFYISVCDSMCSEIPDCLRIADLAAPILRECQSIFNLDHFSRDTRTGHQGF